MKYFCLLFLIFNCQAEELLVNGLANGSCWYQDKDSLKVSSFNDRQSINSSYENIYTNLLNLVPGDDKEILNLHLHCGSQGVSLIARIKSDNSNLCLWAMMDQGKFKIRSLGGTIDPVKGGFKLCDGFKQGELVVILKNPDYLDQLKSEKWKSIIKDIIPVAFSFYKLKLTSEYFLREEEVANILQESFGVKVEFNQFQHGIGEYVQLK